MKKKNLTGQLLKAFLTLVLGSFTVAETKAQPTIATPSTADIPVTSGATYTFSNTCINSANITYTSCIKPKAPLGQLSAIVWDGYTPSLAINDGINATIITPLPSVYATRPDVIIANKSGDCSKFIVGVAYADIGGYVMLALYTVSNAGVSGSLSVTSIGSPINVSTSSTIALNYTPYFPHIDIIAEAGNTGLTGQPYCDKFVITWFDNNINVGSTPTSQVLACTGSLNAMASGTGTMTYQAITAPRISFYEMPDVAAVQQKHGVNIDNVALFVYTDGNIPQTYYQEWNISTSTLNPPTTVAYGSSSEYAYIPRIDAIDDYNVNATATTPWEVVGWTSLDNHAASGGTLPQIISYNVNTPTVISPSILGDDISDPLNTVLGHASSNKNASPGVAYYKNDNTYNAAWAAVDATYGMDEYVAEIDVTTGYLYGAPNQTYYRTNTTSPLGSVVPVGVAEINSCISSSFNTRDHILVCWENEITDQIMYKITGSTHPSFKPAEVNVINLNDKYVLYPNPAKESINIGCPDEAKDAIYSIVDVMGKELSAGVINTNRQAINIQTLTAGEYFLNIFKDGKSLKSLKFVKQ